MRSKKIISLFVIGVFILLLAVNVSAYQKKMAIEECLMSYNDENYGDWDEVNHRGVFVKVINHNLNLGESENADYEYINYQSDSFNPLNTMPILNIEPGKPNMLYTKCTQKVGDYRIYLQDYTVPYQGGGYGLHLSPNFNFNNGITVETGFVDGSSPAYNGEVSTFQHYYYNLKLSPQGSIYYADNGVNSGYDADAIAVYKEGFFPNTRPVVMTKINLTDYASGVLWGYSLIREAGYVMLIDVFHNRFYLNSSTRNIKDFLAAKVVAGGSMTNLDNPNKNGDFTIDTLACTEANDDCFDLSKGGKMQMTYQFRNIYSVPLSNVEVRNTWTTSAPRMGFGRSGTDVSYYTTPVLDETIPDIPAFTTTSYTFERDIPLDNNYIWANTHGYIMFKNIFGDYAQAQYFWPGDDDESLLSFRNFDPRIEMQKINYKYISIFNMTVTLQTANTLYNYEEVFREDFELLFEMWNGTDIKDSYTVSGADVFASAGIASLPQANSIEYSYPIPIKDEYAIESAGGSKYEVYVYVVSKNGGKFDGLKISTPTKVPYFTPGDIAYQWDDTLTFGIDSKIDSKKIVIFNPTFYENDIILEVKSWSDDANFELSWDGETYGQTSKTVHLFPLQSKEVNFWVNATYDPWVSSPISENITITVSADLKVGDVNVEKSHDFDFILNVSNESLRWFNINPVDFFPEVIFLDNLSSSRREKVTVTWSLEGGRLRWEELMGESYNVTIKLISGTEITDPVLKEVNAIFTISKGGETEISFDYDFTYGEYLLVLDLDLNNKIAEVFSSGASGEADNFNVYMLPLLVTYCYYNADGYMHRIDFWGNDVIDKENKCECPREFVTIPDEGFCADPDYDCSAFSVDGVDVCNDWEQTLGGLCGWKCDEPFCPPQPVENGDCLNCSSIQNTCSGYNNEETCIIDPCFKASIYDCGFLGCDIYQSSECIWIGDSDGCGFQGSFNGLSCTYQGKVIQECEGTSGNNKIINFTSTDFENCPPKQRTVACAQDVIGLSFFTTLNLILAIGLITLVYFGKHFVKK